MLRKMIMVSTLAAALDAVLIPGVFAFSGGAPHVVTHPVVISRGAVTAMPQSGTAVRLPYRATQYPRPPSRAWSSATVMVAAPR
jgi:hypothetical protein